MAFSRLPYPTLTGIISLIFIFIGILKISPLINEDFHRSMRHEFRGYAKVFPFSDTFKISARIYRNLAAIIELVFGYLLLTRKSRWVCRFANLVLFLWTLLNLYSQRELRNPIERMWLFLLLNVLTFIRLALDFNNFFFHVNFDPTLVYKPIQSVGPIVPIANTTHLG